MTVCICAINVIVVIFPISRSRIVRRIDVDTIHFSGIQILKKLKRVIVVGFNESVPKIAIGSIANAVHRFEIGIDCITKLCHGHKLVHLKSSNLVRVLFLALCLIAFDFQYSVNLAHLAGFERNKSTSLNGNVIKRRTFGQMLLEHESKFLLFIHSVNFGLYPCAKFRIFYLSDQIINCCHSATPLIPPHSTTILPQFPFYHTTCPK